MKKLVLLLTILTVFAMVSAGLGLASETQFPVESTDYAGRKLVITSAITDEGEFGIAVDAFLQAYPGVEIDFANFTSEKYTELFTAMRNSGEQIDLMILNAQDLRHYALNGDLLPMNDLPFKDRFRDFSIETFTIDGTLWAAPRGSLDGFKVTYNRKMLEKYGVEYPKNYQEMLELNEMLKADGAALITHAGKNIYVWPVWFFTVYDQTTGGQSMEYTIETLEGKRKFTDAECIEAFQIIYNMGKDGLFVKGVNSTDDDGSIANMINGLGFMAISMDWKQVTKATEGLDTVELDFELMPQLTEEYVQPIYPGGPGYALSIYSGISEENLDLAWKFIEYVTRDEIVTLSAQYDDWPANANINVPSPSTVPMVQKFSDDIADHMVVYLDWYWPPEITRAFQEGIQALVDNVKTPDQVGSDIQAVFDKLVSEGYEFVN